MNSLPKKPPPGSREAIEQGCICPVADNHHGEGVPYQDGGPHFWINVKCPLHSSQIVSSTYGSSQ